MAAPKLGLYKVSDTTGTFWFDTRYFPICSVRVIGTTTLELANTFEAWLLPLVDLAESTDQKVIVINDFSSASVPPPDVRKSMAAQANQLNTRKGFGYWVPIVPNRMLRGVLTAVLWMIESDEKRTFYVMDISQAITKCLQLYTQIGHPLPDVTPDEYDFPEPEETL